MAQGAPETHDRRQNPMASADATDLRDPKMKDHRPRRHDPSRQSSEAYATRRRIPRHHLSGPASPRIESSRYNSRRSSKRSSSRKQTCPSDKSESKTLSRMLKQDKHSEQGGFHMTTGQIALIEKKQKLYKETQTLPLWGVRKVVINPSELEDLGRFPNNATVSARYTWYSFLPKNLVEQFHRFANLWFLFVALLQVIIGTEIAAGPWSTAITLLTFLTITGAKDAWEDYHRHRNDTLQNSRVCNVVTSTPPYTTVETAWRDVRVGNILRLTADEIVPADIVVLSCSNSDGIAYVNTVDLNGDAELKPKMAVKETRVKGKVACEQPTMALDQFSGSLKLDAHPRATVLDGSNFIPRGARSVRWDEHNVRCSGSKVRNTDFLFGVVVYTGKDTRLRCNMLRPRRPRSPLEQIINFYIACIIFLLLFCILIAILVHHARFTATNSVIVAANFMYEDLSTWKTAIIFLIRLNNLIPITLMVTIDIVRFLLALVLEKDPFMMCKRPHSTKNGPQVHSGDLCETLGMVDFVFCDKTGTLTQNDVAFRMCVVGGRVYGASRQRDISTSASGNSSSGVFGDIDPLTDSRSLDTFSGRQQSLVTMDSLSPSSTKGPASLREGDTAVEVQAARRHSAPASPHESDDNAGRGGGVPAIVKQVTFKDAYRSSRRAATYVTASHGQKSRRWSQEKTTASISSMTSHHDDADSDTKQPPTSADRDFSPSASASFSLSHSNRNDTTDSQSINVYPKRQGLYFHSPAAVHGAPPLFSRIESTPLKQVFSPEWEQVNATAIQAVQDMRDLFPVPLASLVSSQQSQQSVFFESPTRAAGRHTAPRQQSNQWAPKIPRRRLPPDNVDRTNGRPSGRRRRRPGDSDSQNSLVSPRSSASSATPRSRSPPLSRPQAKRFPIGRKPGAGHPLRSVAIGEPPSLHSSQIDGTIEASVDDATTVHTPASMTDIEEHASRQHSDKLYDDTDEDERFQYVPTGFQGRSDYVERRCLFDDQQLFADLASESWRARKIDEFLKAMALCNTVNPYIEVVSDGRLSDSVMMGNASTKSGRVSQAFSGSFELTKSNLTVKQSPHWCGLFGRRRNSSQPPEATQGDGGTSNEFRETTTADGLTTASTDRRDSSRPGTLPGTSQRRATVVTPVAGLSGREGPWHPAQSAATADPSTNANYASFLVNREPRKSTEPSTVGTAARLSRSVSHPRSHLTGDLGLHVSERGTHGGTRDDGNQNSRLPSRGNDRRGTFLLRYANAFTKRFPSSTSARISHQTKDSTADKRIFNFYRSSVPWDAALRNAILYQAYSPDEECLVCAASCMGYTLVSKSTTHVYLEIAEDRIRRFEVLGINPWTPTRKRMSIVLREEGEDCAIIYCKGADDAMLPLLDEDYDALSRIKVNINRFSLRGLRSLVFGCRYLPRREAEHYRRLYNDARSSIYDKMERTEMAAAHVEKNLELLGISGVLDKLEHGVRGTIQRILESGARIWMMTGDHEDYAIHVAYSSKLLHVNAVVFRAELNLKAFTASRGSRARREGFALFERFQRLRLSEKADHGVCLVVGGKFIPVFLGHRELQSLFLLMACSSDAVLCTRITPAQKAQIVEVMKKRLTPSPITLAVGDGANDVPMLQAADCGVAVEGAECLDAVIASDFVLPRFTDLKRLLFVHGRLSFLRVSFIVLWFFFKTVLLVLPVFFLAPFSLYSGTRIYDTTMYIAFELLFTSIPVILLGVIQWDVPEKVSLHVPLLYALGRRRLYFNGWLFSLWIFEAFCLALVISAVMFGIFTSASVHPQGGSVGYDALSLSFYTTVVLAVNLKLLLECRSLTLLWLVLLVITVAPLFPLAFLRGALAPSWAPVNGIPTVVYGTALFWFALGFCLAATWVVHSLFLLIRKRSLNDFSPDVVRYTNFLEKEKVKEALQQGDQWSPDPAILDATIAKQLQTFYNPVKHPHVVSLLPEPRHFQLTDTVLSHAPLLGSNVSRYSAQGHRHEAKAEPSTLYETYSQAFPSPPPPRRRRWLGRGLKYFLRGTFNKAGLWASSKQTTVHPYDDDASPRLNLRDGRSDTIRDARSEAFPPPRSTMFGSPRSSMIDDDVTTRSPDDDFSLASSSHVASEMYGAERGGMYHRSSATPSGHAVKISDLIRRLTLRFRDQQLEAEFKSIRTLEYKKYKVWYRLAMVAMVVAHLLQISSDLYNYHTLGSWQKYLGVCFVSGMLGWYCIWVFFIPSFYLYVDTAILALLMSFAVGFVLVSFSQDIPFGIQSIFGTLTFVIMRIPFVLALLANGLFLAAGVLGYWINGLPRSTCWLALPYTLGILCFTGFAGYRLEYNQRKRFLLNYQVEVSRRKQREILNTMLPSFVVEKMLNATITRDGIPIDLKAEDRGTVTVVFCDVYDFQKLVISLEPTRLVEVLDSLFLCFDKCAEQFGCTKIETVFETYLAAAGLRPGREGGSDFPSQDAFDALDMSLTMLEVATFIKYETLQSRETAAAATPTQDEPDDDDDDDDVNGGGRRPLASASAFSLRSYRSASGLSVASKTDLEGKTMGARDLQEQQQQQQHHVSDKDGGESPSGGFSVSVRNSLTLSKSRRGCDDAQGLPQHETCRIRVKVGIHSGRVISGVVGAKKPQYALFGDTVNTASRMKLTGEPDHIHVSNATYSLVESDDTLTWEPRALEVKGKGLMKTYLLTSVAQSAYPHFGRPLEDGMEDDAQDSGHVAELPLIQPYEVSHRTPSSRRQGEDTTGISPRRPGAALERRPLVFQRDPVLRAPPPPLVSSVVGPRSPHDDNTTMHGTQSPPLIGTESRESSFQRHGRIQSALTTVQRSMRRVSVFQPLRSRHPTVTSTTQQPPQQQERSRHVTAIISPRRHDDGAASVPRSSCVSTESTFLERSTPMSHSAPRSDRGERHGVSGGSTTSVSLSEAKAIPLLRDRRRFGGGTPDVVASQRGMATAGAAAAAAPTSLGVAAGGGGGGPSEAVESVTVPGAAAAESTGHELSQADELVFSVGQSSKLQLYLFTLSFRDREQEEEYKKFFYNSKPNIDTIEQSLIIFLVTFVTHTVIELAFDGKRQSITTGQTYNLRDTNQFWAVRAAYTCIWFLTWILFHYRARPEIQTIIGVRWMTFFLNVTLISAACIFLISGAWAYNFDYGVLEWMETDIFQLVFFLTVMHHNTGLLFQHVILVDSLLFAMVIVYVKIVCARTPIAVATLFSIFPMIFFNGLAAHHKENIDRLTWYVSEEMQTTEDRARELLKDMLPKQVLEEFQQDKLKLAYRHDRMTFLFADICGFTSYANSVDATEVVQLLQQLFARFDRDSTRFGLYKLCTIGDAYVAVSEPVTEDNPDWNPVEGAQRVLEMANAMIEKIKDVRERLNIPGLNMRIGLHYGKCVGGVIGSGRLRYDLWGIDVLTGNLMEAHGVPGKINVSEVLKEFLEEHFPGRFRFKFNRPVKVIEQVVNSYLLQDSAEEETEPEEDKQALQELRGAARKARRRFSVLGMRFGGREDEKTEPTASSGVPFSAHRLGSGGPTVATGHAGGGHMVDGTVEGARGAVRRGSITRFFNRISEDVLKPPEQHTDHTPEKGVLNLEKLREMFQNIDLSQHGHDDDEEAGVPGRA